MELTVVEAARLLKVSEDVVYKWIREDGLPASRFGDRYHLNRVKVIEWAHENRAPLALENGQDSPTLASALELGGVHSRVPGRNPEEALRAILERMPLPQAEDRELILQMILARERQGSTAVGGGIAIPHARNPMLLRVSRPLVALCYPENPLDFATPDGEKIFALFVMATATLKDHLRLVSRISMALHDERFLHSVRSREGRDGILARIREIEMKERKSVESVAGGTAS